MKAKRMLRTTFLYLLFFSVYQQVFAQSRVITGSVSDDKNNPVASASVTVKGTTIGTAADSLGNFSLTVPSNAKTLVVASVGYNKPGS